MNFLRFMAAVTLVAGLAISASQAQAQAFSPVPTGFGDPAPTQEQLNFLHRAINKLPDANSSLPAKNVAEAINAILVSTSLVQQGGTLQGLFDDLGTNATQRQANIIAGEISMNLFGEAATRQERLFAQSLLVELVGERRAKLLARDFRETISPN